MHHEVLLDLQAKNPGRATMSRPASGRVRSPSRSRHAALTVALGALCVSTEAAAFRSSSDLDEFAEQSRVSFASSKISLELFQELPSDLQLSQVEEVLNRAAEKWNEPACTNLTMSYMGTTHQEASAGDGRNTIQWVDDWMARGFPKEAPGLTDVQYVSDDHGHWTIAEADTYLNLDYGWTTGVPTDAHRSLLAVLTHELGHVLGLLHPCELDGADGVPTCNESPELAGVEMHPVYSPDQTVLSDDDIAGLCFLYSPVCAENSCDEGQLCLGGVCTPLCGSAVCAAGTVCKSDVCVASRKECGLDGCVGQPCSEPSDCGEREFCDGRVCARGDGALGDPCSSARQCFDGACFDGSCVESCGPGNACGSGVCDVDSEVCTAEFLPLGAACKFSTDCRGGYCLAEAGHAPVCSRSCADEQPACPSGWACRHADEQPVCAPAAKPDDGCSINPAPRSYEASYRLFLGAVLFACWRPLRRWRTRRSRS